MMNIIQTPRALFLVAVLSLVRVLMVSADSSAQPLPIPDSLFLEVVTAPGYDWMKACKQAGGPAAQAAADGSKQAGGSDHAAHHPPQSPASASQLGEAGLSQTIHELQRTIEALQLAKSGVESR